MSDSEIAEKLNDLENRIHYLELLHETPACDWRVPPTQACSQEEMLQWRK